MDPQALLQLLGARIRALRVDEALTQAALGRRCQMSAAEICRFERGQRSPRLVQLQRLARALGVPMWTLLITSEPVFELLLALRHLPLDEQATIARRLRSAQDARLSAEARHAGEVAVT